MEQPGFDLSTAARIFEACRPSLTVELREATAPWLAAVVTLDDVFQNAWIPIQEHFAACHFETEAQMAAWIREIVRMTHKDLIRRERTQKRDRNRVSIQGSGYLEWVDEAPGTGPTPSGIMDLEEQRQRLQQEIRALSPDQQAATNLAMHGHSGSGIAGFLGRSLHAVYTYGKKARTRLRERLGNEDLDD